MSRAKQPKRARQIEEVTMRGAAWVLGCCVMLASGWAQTPAAGAGPESASGRALSAQLVGAWRLVRVETKRPNGEVIYPFYGKHPAGLIVYDRSGSMTVQIVSDPAPAVPRSSSREGFLSAPAAEKVMAAEGFYAYYGVWSVNAAGTAVTHHIEQSFYPGERDEDVTREVELTGDRLVLIARAHEMGEDHERRLTWARVSSPAR